MKTDRMTPLPFDALMTWILTEHHTHGSVFSVSAPYRHTSSSLSLFAESPELPFGVAAGPHTQLAQNIITAYWCGARFFELKTVQTLDGEDLPVSKPCILALDEGYNVEWSTELTVEQALEEYVKAWFALKLLSREFALGSTTGFVFNMSVGYDYLGICSEKIDHFIEGLKDASALPIWDQCQTWAKAHLQHLPNWSEAEIDSISPQVCRSITLSTLHGCPPEEIERIAAYLIEKKNLHTFVKLNPTLLGYEFAKKTLFEMGFTHLTFDRHHFENDLQYGAAVPMLYRLYALAEKQGVSFGVKLTNTFPVKIAQGELPGEEMYMSGRSLFPLSTALAAKLSASFFGKLPISYSGGADAGNSLSLVEAGIWPVTVATTLLKPGGYQRLTQMAQLLAPHPPAAFTEIDVPHVEKLALAALKSARYHREEKGVAQCKIQKPLPLDRCFAAPCRAACPIEQDIPAYLSALEKGEYALALQIILERNPLPFTTGSICPHRCTTGCTRNFYEQHVAIREAKLSAAQKGFSTVLSTLAPPTPRNQSRVAVVGGGPGGMAAAYFAARAGATVTLFEERAALGGIVHHVIPSFRIGVHAIENDARLLAALGVEVRLNTRVTPADVADYDVVFAATGAWVPGKLTLEKGNYLEVLSFLQQFKKDPTSLKLGEHVVVVGGGNTAMDAARAALRVPFVSTATVVYRRTTEQMPADLEEIRAALAEGVTILELLAPLSLENQGLTCAIVKLGALDHSGRPAPVETEETMTLVADSLIVAVGERAEQQFIPDGNRVFVIGDAKRGPATVVQAIADAMDANTAAFGCTYDRYAELNASANRHEAAHRKGTLCSNGDSACLQCATLCQNCVDVCPNRANIALQLAGESMPFILHLDGLCNECGNCKSFCPYDAAPYQQKLTLFWDRAAFDASKNDGFFVEKSPSECCVLRLKGALLAQIPPELVLPISTVLQNYRWLLPS